MVKVVNRHILRFASILALLCSCSEMEPDSRPVIESEVTVLQAFQESNATKATYDGTAINWDANDALSVFPAGSSSSVKFSKKEGDNNYFTCSGSVSLENIYALYPYNPDATFAGGRITTAIKTVQTATPGTFAPDANVAVAFSAEGGQVRFKNAVSYIKVRYKTAYTDAIIRKITFQTLDGAAISGRVSLNPSVSGGEVADVAVSVATGQFGGVNYVELNGNILPDTDYYLAVAPVNLSRGYRLIFTDANGNRFAKEYKADSNKARLQRNTISYTGLKNLDNYEANVTAYWRVTSADDFTGDNDKYLLVQNTEDSSTGYRVFDQNKTDVFISTGQPLVDKFAGGTIEGLSSKLSAWKAGGSAPLFMSHYVLYCFRDAYSDDGLQFGPHASEVILNPDDAYAFTVSTSSDSSLDKVTSFNLCYKYSGQQSTEVTLTNCYLSPVTADTFLLMGKITQTSIDGLVDVFFLSKGSSFRAAVSPNDIHSGADRAVNALSQIGFCAQEITTQDNLSTISHCFMIKNRFLCNTPNPAAVLLYKKVSRPVAFKDYKRLFSN